MAAAQDNATVADYQSHALPSVNCIDAFRSLPHTGSDMRIREAKYTSKLQKKASLDLLNPENNISWSSYMKKSKLILCVSLIIIHAWKGRMFQL